MREFLKVVFAHLLTPSALLGILLFIGIIFLWLRKNEKIGKILLTISATLLLIFSYDPIPEILLNSYENQYKKLNIVAVDKSISFVVVLGGGYAPTPSKPITSNLMPGTLIRLIEGIRLAKKFPTSKLVLTGRGRSQETEAEGMARLAVELGFDKNRIIIDPLSANTYQHTRKLKPLIGEKPFILVTSALHIPRAMGMFKKAGMQPIAAPTGHLLRGDHKLFRISSLYPLGQNLYAMDLYFYEIWGTVWGKLRGHL